MHEGMKKVFRFEAMRRWPHVVRAVARYIGDDAPTNEQMAAARWAEGASETLDAIAEYATYRGWASGRDTAVKHDPRVPHVLRRAREENATMLRDMIAAAIAAR